jgi:hypothetical protein
LGDDHPDVAMFRSNLAGVLLDLRRTPEALEMAEAAWDRQQRDDIPAKARAETAFVLARALWRADADEPSRARAEALARDALEVYDKDEAEQTHNAQEVRAWLEDPEAR